MIWILTRAQYFKTDRPVHKPIAAFATKKLADRFLENTKPGGSRKFTERSQSWNWWGADDGVITIYRLHPLELKTS